MEYRPTAEQLLYSNYIKYDRLYHLSKHAFYGLNSSSLDVYLDMNSLLRVLYRYTRNLSINNYSVITSSLINLCAHLRNYYWTRHQVATRFFIVYAGNNPAVVQDNYNITNLTQDTNNSFLTGVINENFGFLGTLCPYLNDIFFIPRKNVETSVVIYDLICRSGNIKTPKMILTKDPFAYQVVSMAPNTFVFRPRKASDNATREQMDVSWCVTKNNIFDVYQTEDLHNKNLADGPIKLNNELFSLIISMAGLKSRDTKSIYRFNTAYQIVSNMVQYGQILNKYNSDVNFIIRNHPGELKGSEYIAIAFKSLDLYTQYNNYIMSFPVDYSRELVNLYSPEEVKSINNKYFRENPLDLQWL